MKEKNRNSIEVSRKVTAFTTMNVIDGQAGLISYASLIFYSLTIDNILNIIVLLILAGVSIATLSGPNGILRKTNEAETQTEISSEKEKVELSAMGARAKNNGGEITEKNLEEELTSYIGIRNVDYELTGTGPFVIKYLESGRSYQIDENGNVNDYENVDILKYVKIGDYVNYVPDNKADNVYYDKFGETYSGYANENIGQDDTLKWRVLNINTDGTLDLISDKPTSTIVYFKGAIGYNNGVYLLNDYCKTMYSNSSKGAIARSLNIEDIQDKMKVIDETTGKKAYEDYINDTAKLKYGKTYSYDRHKWYPLQFKNDNGVIGESKQETVQAYSSEDEAKAEETAGDLILTQTYWYLLPQDMRPNFITADTRDSSKANSMYDELFKVSDHDDTYWLASRFVNPFDTVYGYFGLRAVEWGTSFSAENLLTTFGDDAYSHNNKVRPVVSIKSNIIDIDVGYDEKNGWSLK